MDAIFRVITAYKRRFVHKIRRRPSSERLKRRLYYRIHKAKIRLQRKRYRQKNKLFLRSRKLFKRVKPHWFAPKKHRKYKVKKYKAKKIKIKKPRIPRPRKVHAPRRLSRIRR